MSEGGRVEASREEELPFTGQIIYMTRVSLPPHVHTLGLRSMASGSPDEVRRWESVGASNPKYYQALVVLGLSTISMTIEEDRVPDVTEWAGN